MSRDSTYKTVLRRISHVAHDTFTDSSGVALGSHTSDSGSLAWVAQSGTWTIDTNKAKCSASGGIIVAQTGISDVYVSCLVTPNNGGTCGLSIRNTDIDNNWLIGLEPGFSGLVIYERTAGVLTLRASTAAVLSNGTEYRMTVRAIGTSITMFVDGVSGSVSYTSASHRTATKHGLRCGTAPTTDRWDNFAVGRA